MKRILVIFLIIICTQSIALSTENAYKVSDLTIYSLNNKYGLKDKSDKVVVYAKYKKLIRLGENAWIIQEKNKFGMIDCNGNYLIKPKYSHVERIFGRFAKLGNEKDYGLYNDKGEAVIPPEFTSIDPLFGGRFLTCKNYKYGIYNNKGDVILDNDFDFIYMPNPKTLRIQYKGNWYEIESISKNESIKLPDDSVQFNMDNQDFKMTQVFINTGIGTGYTVVTATDYLLKIFASISPAYEQTIDDLMLSQGAETVSIFVKLGWIPKFPFVYAKKYWSNLVQPNKSPLAEVRNELKGQIK